MRLALLLFLFAFATTSYSQSITIDFEDENENAEWQEFNLGVSSQFYEWEIGPFQGSDDSEGLAHYYPVGGEEITDDWFVSPAFSLGSGALIDSIWHRFSGFGLPFGVDTVALYLVEGNANPALATSTTLLHLFTDENYMNDNIARTTENIIVPASSEPNAYLAFRYKTIVNWLDVRFDNIVITFPMSVAPDHPIESFIYPNPASDQLTIQYGEIPFSHMQLISPLGQVVREWKELPDQLDVSTFEPGMYRLVLMGNGRAESLPLAIRR